MAFKKAVKFESKLRMAIAGPAGAGKTWTALKLATALADGGSVALIDTEHDSALKYADQFDFDHQGITNFHPNNYITLIREAEEAGYAVLIIDSLSHAWTGPGGVLEEKDKIARQKYGGNTFSAWNDASQLQNKLVQTMLSSKIHIIATVRSKMDYVLETNQQGKQVPRKVGMAPVQRDDLAYEFDVFATMEIDNTMIIDKSRCPALSGQVIPKPDEQVAQTLSAWLVGAPAPAPLLTVKDVYDVCVASGACMDEENRRSFLVYASSLLGAPVTAKNVMQLTQEQLIAINDAAKEGYRLEEAS